VKEGRFFSELSIFPIQKGAFNLTFKNNTSEYILPNKGKFTCYNASSLLLSGSYKEWNRINSLLIDNLDKNAYLTLRKMLQNSESSFNLSRYFISGKEFEMNICEGLKSKNKKQKSVANFNVRNIQYPASFILSWLKIYKTRCFSNNRPLIFTFFQPKKGFFSNERFTQGMEGLLVKSVGSHVNQTFIKYTRLRVETINFKLRQCRKITQSPTSNL